MPSPPCQTSVKRTSAGSPDSPRRTLTSWTSVESRFSAKTRRSRGVKSPIASRISASCSARSLARASAGTSMNRRISWWPIWLASEGCRTVIWMACRFCIFVISGWA